jgi:anti-sigma B factor antagonist
MEIKLGNIEDVQIVKIQGEIDAKTSPLIQQQVLPLVESHEKFLVDLSEVEYMSSAGLRMLLSLYRQISTHNGKLVLVGLSEEIEDTMSVTGFLDFLTVADNISTGIKALS